MTTALKEVIRDAAAHGHHDSRLQLYAACGSGALGYHQRCCSNCEARALVPNACRSRACPFCCNRERGEWVQAQESNLPAVPYFHVVFTVPSELRACAASDPKATYRCLMDAVRQALLTICADERHLGVTPIAFAVLHTWDQRLHLHPHVHVVVSAGGLTAAGDWRWAGSTRRKAFLVPLKVLRAHFRSVLLRKLAHCYASEAPLGWCERWSTAAAFAALLAPLRRMTWCVHLERPLGGPQALIRYLARYVNRVAIAPQRVSGYDGETVHLAWRDRRHGNQPRTDILPASTFLARFRHHIPPKGLVRLRYWGLLAHRQRAQQLARCATALAKAPPAPANLPRLLGPPRSAPESKRTPCIGGLRCPRCGGEMTYDGHHRRLDALDGLPEPFS